MRQLYLGVGKKETSRSKRFIINKLGLLMAIVLPSLNPLLHEALPGHKKLCHLIHIVLNRKNEYMIYC